MAQALRGAEAGTQGKLSRSHLGGRRGSSWTPPIQSLLMSWRGGCVSTVGLGCGPVTSLPPAKALHFHFAVGPMHYAAGPAKIQTQEMELLITVQISPSSIREGQHLFLIPSAVQLALIAASLPAPLYGKRGTCGTGNQRALPGFALCSSHRMRDFPFSCSNRCPHVSSEGSIDHYFKTTNKDKVSPRG